LLGFDLAIGNAAIWGHEPHADNLDRRIGEAQIMNSRVKVLAGLKSMRKQDNSSAVIEVLRHAMTVLAGAKTAHSKPFEQWINSNINTIFFLVASCRVQDLLSSTKPEAISQQRAVEYDISEGAIDA
jgi:hypothetical protein